jgi:hypothetical protein
MHAIIYTTPTCYVAIISPFSHHSQRITHHIGMRSNFDKEIICVYSQRIVQGSHVKFLIISKKVLTTFYYIHLHNFNPNL